MNPGFEEGYTERGLSISSAGTSCIDAFAECYLSCNLSDCLSDQPPSRSTEEPSSAAWSSESRTEETHSFPSEDSRTSSWKKQINQTSEIYLMKERFAKLLLGEDMSGSGKGVCTALAISNAITNLAASVFGELWRLQPLSPERIKMWSREMDWLLSISNYIVELVPSSPDVSEGSPSTQVMITRKRSDLHINLPALRKLDAMLLENLDSFKQSEFWYVDQGISVSEKSAQKYPFLREEGKWWLPIPRVPMNGLSNEALKNLHRQRSCTRQILKAVMAINYQVLSEMEIPKVYWDSLPKNARLSLGETVYRALESESFPSSALFSLFDLSSEHKALDAANSIEAAIHIWQKKLQHARHPLLHDGKFTARYAWEKVKDLVDDSDKRLVLITRAESMLQIIKQRFPGLPQTSLEIYKIQFNTDVGQAILEAYSRVLESLAFSILSRIEDVLYVHNVTRKAVGILNLPVHETSSRKRPDPVCPIYVPSSTPYETPFASPSATSSVESSPHPVRPPNSPAVLRNGILLGPSSDEVQQSEFPYRPRPCSCAGGVLS